MYSLAFKLGHSYFDGPNGTVAVADDSMRNRIDPRSTDDGLLLLDTGRRVSFTYNDRADIPVITEEGRHSFTCGTWAEGMQVCRAFRMGPSFDGRLQSLVTFANHAPQPRQCTNKLVVEERDARITPHPDSIGTYRQGGLRPDIAPETIDRVIGGDCRVPDDAQKVKHSWQFNFDGTPCAIWDYKGARWSTFGPAAVFATLFGSDSVRS